jgi:hypothetical protein
MLRLIYPIMALSSYLDGDERTGQR